MNVKDLAKDLATTADTVRFYTRKGFLQPIKSNVNGYKEYGPREIQRLRFILSARQLGFSVNDIKEIFNESDKGDVPCAIVRKVIVQRLQETDLKFHEMIALRTRMQSAVKEWADKPDKAPTGQMICHLIENFMPN